jgi:hypothetical protein
VGDHLVEAALCSVGACLCDMLAVQRRPQFGDGLVVAGQPDGAARIPHGLARPVAGRDHPRRFGGPAGARGQRGQGVEAVDVAGAQPVLDPHRQGLVMQVGRPVGMRHHPQAGVDVAGQAVDQREHASAGADAVVVTERLGDPHCLLREPARQPDIARIQRAVRPEPGHGRRDASVAAAQQPFGGRLQKGLRGVVAVTQVQDDALKGPRAVRDKAVPAASAERWACKLSSHAAATSV